MITITMARIGLVAAGLMAMLPGSAQAQEEGQLVKDLLGSMGVIAEDRPPIDYRERPPLVLPPRLELREPLAPGSVQARNPQWPVDPDVARLKRSEAEAQLPAGTDEKSRITRGHGRLSVEEMRTGRAAGAQLATTPVRPKRDNEWVDPDVLRAQNHGRSTKAAANEGVRRSLTDPPSSYQKPATGEPIKKSFEARERVDLADPKAYHREQALRR